MEYAIEVLEKRKLRLTNDLKELQGKVGVLVFFGEDPKHIQEERDNVTLIENRIGTLDDAIARLRGDS